MPQQKIHRWNLIITFLLNFFYFYYLLIFYCCFSFPLLFFFSAIFLLSFLCCFFIYSFYFHLLFPSFYFISFYFYPRILFFFSHFSLFFKFCIFYWEKTPNNLFQIHIIYIFFNMLKFIYNLKIMKQNTYKNVQMDKDEIVQDRRMKLLWWCFDGLRQKPSTPSTWWWDCWRLNEAAEGCPLAAKEGCKSGDF